MNLLRTPGLIGEDNQGAIFLANNKQVSQRTKHIGSRSAKHQWKRAHLGPILSRLNNSVNSSENCVTSYV